MGRSAEAWATAKALANLRLDFVQTNALDHVVQELFGDGGSEQVASNPTRLAILGSSTLSHLHSGLRVAALRRGIWLETYESPYDQYLQELLDPSSALHAFAPTLVLFAFDSRHLLAGLDAGQSEADADAIFSGVREKLLQCWRLTRQSFDCPILQQTLLPVFPSLLGSNEHRLPGSMAGGVARVNCAMRSLADEEGVDLLALDKRVAQDGLSAWYDPALWYRSKQEITPAAAPMYGELAATLIAAQQGRSFKCLVLDLDNTLWGGVIGDDGLDGIVLGQGSALGEAFVAVQRYALELSRRGVILAVCSKNDEANAWEPFDLHPEMLLKREHIACFAANWNDKAANIRTVAQELNIGLDSLVFLDDNPFERTLIRQELPMVAVPEVPDDPALVPQCLADAGYFDVLGVTEDDRKRTRQYQGNKERLLLKASSTDMESYLRGLDMKLFWRRFDRLGLLRIVQLINKTNQFNLTTRRYGESEILALMEDPNAVGLQLRLTDRLGDNGMISVVIGRLDPSLDLLIDTWLMSCRVLGRQVEAATLNLLAAQAVGARRLIGEYRPTAKNGMVREHYQKLGFAILEEEADGTVRSSLELRDFVPLPTFIETREG